MYINQLMKFFKDDNNVVTHKAMVDPNISQGQRYLNTIKGECVQLKGNLNIIEGFESNINLTDEVGDVNAKNMSELQELEQEFQTKLQAFITANSNYNNVIIGGNLNCDSSFWKTKNGTPVANFFIASNRKFKDNSGQWRENVCYVGVVCDHTVDLRNIDHLSDTCFISIAYCCDNRHCRHRPRPQITICTRHDDWRPIRI